MEWLTAMARSVRDREQPVGHRLVARHARVGEVLVEDEPRPRQARREPPEVGGGVAVDVEDPRAPAAGEGDEVGEDPGVEAAPSQVVDRDALLAEPVGGRLGAA